MPPPAQPISFLSPFVGRNWTIKGRVTDKSEVRTWNKPNSSGRLAAFTLVDESSAIRVTMFNEQIDRFNHMLTPGTVIYLSGGSIKTANKRFSSVANDYELTLEDSTNIEVCNDVSAANTIPLTRYNFLSINCLEKCDANKLVDVLGVVLTIGEPAKIVSKSTGKELHRVTLRVADQTAAVDVTIWGNDAPPQVDANVGEIVALRAARVGTFDGCSLSVNSTSIDRNPRVNGVDSLALWYKNTGGADAVSISNRTGGAGGASGNNRGRKYIDQVIQEGLGKSEKGDYIDLRCTPFYMRAESLTYLACPTCNRKVQSDANSGAFHCEKCATAIVHPSHRYMCSMHVSDNVATTWVTLFNEAGEQFFGCSADVLMKAAESDPNFIVSSIATRLFQPVVMRVRVSEDTYGGTDSEARLRYTCMKIQSIAQPVQNYPEGIWAQEAEILANELALY